MALTDLTNAEFDLSEYDYLLFSISFEKLKTCEFCQNPTPEKRKHNPYDCLMAYLWLHIARQRPLTYSPETNRNHKERVIEEFDRINNIRIEAGLKPFRRT
jgi:hypothetical protein